MEDSPRLHNFCAGPGALPLEVVRQVRHELPVYKNAGASVMEISHRSDHYTALEESSRAALRRLLGMGSEWHILFLGCGASMQFHQVPLNFLVPGGTADYVVTGIWAKKAHTEAARLGAAHVVASSEGASFTYIPTGWEDQVTGSYVHYTSNNTVCGTQYIETPGVKVPLVCDASSDFLSRPIDLDSHGLIYAGAQKNIGPAGVTVVLVRDDFLGMRNQPLPSMMDYGVHAAKLFNTPPVFAVYVVEKVLRWLEGRGGLEAIRQQNTEKAALLYGRIDATGFYRGTARKADRSMMNVTFRLPTPELEKRFVGEAEQHGLLALKGHRSVGGIRASIYNACPKGSVLELIEFMNYFEAKNG